MVGPFLREATILIVFCYIFVSGKDILEIFQPDPSLPQELNEWLDNVQKHKGDFRYIREILAQKNKKSLFNLEDDYEDYHKEDAKEIKDDIGSNSLDIGKVNVDLQPKNDIYPYMYKNINDLIDYGKNTLKSLDDNKRVNSKNVKSPIRLRRSPDDLNFFDSQNSVNIDSKAVSGEIRRTDDKYPERFMSNRESNIVEADSKINAENDLKEDNSIKKRNIQIDIKSNGRLVKQIREDTQDPKSLVLHIQSPVSTENEAAVVDAGINPKGNLEPTFNSIFEYRIQPPHLSIQEIPVGAKNLPLSACRHKHSQPNQMKDREIESNYLNLFSANEQLTTDRSLMQKTQNTKKEHLVYTIKLPNSNKFPYVTFSYSYPRNYQFMGDNNNPKIQLNNGQNPNANDFNHNNLQDMSNFWTPSEKMQMQQGLQFAYVTDNLRKMTQSKLSQKFRAIKDNETGFEPAQRIELDNDTGAPPPQNAYSGDIVEANKDNIENIHDSLKPENKRHLETPQLINNDNLGQSLRNLDIALDNSLSSLGLLNSGNMESKRNYDNLNKELSLDNTKLTPNHNMFDEFQPLEENSGIALAGNNMEGNADSLNSDDSVDSANSVESADSVNSADSIDTADSVDSAGSFDSAGSVDTVPSTIDNPAFHLGNGENKLNRVETPTDEIALDDKTGNQRNEEFIEKTENVIDNPPREYSEDVTESKLFKSPEKFQKGSAMRGPSRGIHRIKNHPRKLQKHFRKNKPFTEDDAVTEIDYQDVEDEDEEYEQPDMENLVKNNVETSNINKKHANQGSQYQDYEYQQCTDETGGDEYGIKDNDVQDEAPTAIKSFRQFPSINGKLSPNSRNIVVLNNKTPYELTRARCYLMNKSGFKSKNAKINCDEELSEPQDQSNWNSGNERSHNTNPLLSNELNPLIKRRVKSKHPKRHRRKHRKHRKHKHNENFDLNAFNELISNDYQSYLNENSDNINVNYPNMKSDLIPAFIGRQLKTVDYAYDAYLDKPGEDYYEEVSTERQEVAEESGNLDDTLHKKSIEGEYGDEEDNATEKNKKSGYSIIKKTENEFANPRTTTENDDEYYNENYDDKSFSSRVNKATTKDIDARNAKKSVPESTPILKIPEIKYSGLDSFGHHGHHKYNPKIIYRKHTRSVPLQKHDKQRVIEPRDTNAVNSSKNHKSKRKTSRSQYFKNNIINRRFADSKGDFQHWPSFVISDHENEEQLRKRSPLSKNKYPRYNFPLSVNDFFVKPQKKNSNEIKREKPNEKEALVDDVDKPLECKALADKVLATDTCTTPKQDFAEKFFTTSKNAFTDAESPDPTDPCVKQNLSNVCEENENFNKTTVHMTTILAILPEAELECGNDSTHHVLEKLDDVLSGKMGLMLRDHMLDELSDNLKLRNRFNKGIQKTDKTIIHKTLNDTNAETKKLLKAMTRIMERLELTATCQTLPRNLVAYLKSITKVKKEDSLAKTKEMEEVQFDENQNQSNFIFESSDQGDNLQGKVKVLEDLLEKYHNLPERCKSRAQPVKEYIENHLTMLRKLISDKEKGPQTKIKKSVEARSDDDAWQNEDALIREQLDSLGLGKEHNFKPQFSLREMIENNKYGRDVTSHDNQATARPQKVNVNKRDLHTVSRTKQYKKLVDAVRKLRLRREGERRLGEVFGKSNKESSDYGGFNLDLEHKDNEDMSKANFESPLVYSL